MRNVGPQLEYLTRRLAECPEEFLENPRQGRSGSVYVDAVVTDLIMDCGGTMPSDGDLKNLRRRGANNRNLLRQVLIASWLLHDDWFIKQKSFGMDINYFIYTGLADLSKLVDASLLVTDPDRREEFVRICLNALHLRPEGENQYQAQDRLQSLDSVERDKVIRKSRAKVKRARELREEMKRKQAQEAASRYQRE